MAFMQQFQQQNQLSQQMSTLRSILQGDTSAMVQSLAQSNPSFAQFMAQNRGKTPEEAFKAYGYDLSEVLGLINS
jgi:hypothetical protein